MVDSSEKMTSFHVNYNNYDPDIIFDRSEELFVGNMEATLGEVVSRHQHPDLMGSEENTNGALEVQVGGGHYKEMPIQPVEFSQRNGLGFCEGNMVKYAVRHREKNGIEDLKKVKHYAELCAWLEYGEEI